jgi:hypothetical protein
MFHSTIGRFLPSVILRSVIFYLKSFYLQSFYVRAFYVRSFYLLSFYVRSVYVLSRFQSCRMMFRSRIRWCWRTFLNCSYDFFCGRLTCPPSTLRDGLHFGHGGKLVSQTCCMAHFVPLIARVSGKPDRDRQIPYRPRGRNW